jgi:preprotein translocase subunit YajC
MAYLLLPILLILMYLMLLRPQQQRLRNQRQLVSSLDVGDDIVTAGGIIGRIVALTDERATVEVADGVTIDFLRAAISRKADEAFAGRAGDLHRGGEDIDLVAGSDADAGTGAGSDRGLGKAAPDVPARPDRTDEETR